MELESVGIRLNKKKPNIYFKVSEISVFILSQAVNSMHIKCE